LSSIFLNHFIYRPYAKPNSKPMYIHIDSNHPPSIIKCIPTMISDRINKLSSDKNIFDRAAKYYNDALATSGYNKKITFDNNPSNTTKSRSRNIIWFNPPYSKNVKFNVAKTFLKIIDKNFPKSHKFNKLFNRNNLKVSYSCLPNISSIISSHNKKVLNSINQTDEKMCNCRNNNNCPLNGKCLEKSVIYMCNVKASEQDEGLNYIGLTENRFKERWYQHKNSFKYENKALSTELSKHVWKLKKKGILEPILTWAIIDHASPYKNGSKLCDLCLTEKYHIITTKKKLLNKRTELVSKCRHSNKFVLKNIKAFPPDHA